MFTEKYFLSSKFQNLRHALERKSCTL